MKRCYLCGEYFPDVEHSEEHIIPNALGGHLKRNDILCKTCNTELNKQVDVDFIRIFDPIYLRMPYKRDRDTNNKVLPGKSLTLGLTTVTKNGKTTPRTPYFEENNRVLYAPTQKMGNDYIAKLIKDGKVTQEEKIEVRDNITDILQYDFNLDNKAYKKGMAKIALGFASMHNVEREMMPYALDYKERVINEKLAIIPHLPINYLDTLLEDNKYYPMHSLMMVADSDTGLLYVYIELFSTFNVYVLLNEDYSGGKLFKFYAYDLMQNRSITIEEYVNQYRGSDEIMRYLQQSRDFRYVRNPALKWEQRNYCSLKFLEMQRYLNERQLGMPLNQN